MTSTNPNLITIWSPEGEPFEMSKINATDLVEHAGWLRSPPVIIEKIVVAAPAVAPAPEPEPEDTTDADDGEGSVEDAETDEEATDEEAGADEEGTDEAEVIVRQSVEDFADLLTREDIVAYLAENFPDFTPHHRAGRDGLVEKAVELIAASAE